MKPSVLTEFSILFCVILNCKAFYRTETRALNHNVSELLNQLLAEGKYDKRIRPNIGGSPITVAVNMYVKSFGPIIENDEKYVMDVYFRQSWYDERLQFNVSRLDELSMSWLLLDKLWKPDTFFLNGMKSHLHRITSPNKFVRIRNDGFLTYSMRLTLTATCKMFLRKFPFDTQTCPLLVGSFGYTADEVNYKWQSEKPVDIEPGLELAQYDLANITAIKNKRVSIGKDIHSIIQINFLLKRNTGFFVLQTYVPCSLMVCSSWVSFWIDPDAVPARVSLGVTTVLSITTIGFGGRSSLPKTNHATSLDWFIILCFAFVFAVMIEYAVVNFIDKKTQDIKTKLAKHRENEKSPAEAQEEEIQDIDLKSDRNAAETQDDIIQSPEDTSKDSNEPPRTPFTKKWTSEPIIYSDFKSTTNFKRDLENSSSYTIIDLSSSFLGSTKSWFRQKSKVEPFHLFDFIHILPTEKDIINELESENIAEKFSVIDIGSRTYFPLTFTVLSALYFIMYIYIIEDETPISLYN